MLRSWAAAADAALGPSWLCLPSMAGPDPRLVFTALHWYSGDGFDDVDKAHTIAPDKFLMATEACEGYLPWAQVRLVLSRPLEI